MKISELINKLENIQVANGDMNIWLNDINTASYKDIYDMKIKDIFCTSGYDGNLYLDIHC